MKRAGVPRLAGPEDQPPLIIATGPQIQQQSVGTVHSQGSSVGLHEAPSSHQTTIIVSTQQVINYSKGTLQYAGAQYPAGQAPKLPVAQPTHMTPPLQIRHKGGGGPGSQSPGAGAPALGGTQFQRLKVEDALSYLDQVKFKFNNQPQVYNDFLDIMKEFKSQSIDTPGVIARVSNLFKGHPELIVGFNTFLPPGYKIEVQANDQGYAYQVSVSMPSPNSALQHQQGHNNITHAGLYHKWTQAVLGSGPTGLLVGPPTVPSQQTHSQHHMVQIIPGSGPALMHAAPPPAPSPTAPPSAPAPVAAPASVAPAPAPPAAPTNTLHHISQAHQQLEAPPAHSAQQPVEFNHAIEYVNKIKNRFNRQPEKYKRFLEILHAYQRGQKELKEPQVKQQTEQEVYAQVAKLFENQDDLLQEFGQFLPDATGGAGGAGGAIKSATAALDAARPGLEPVRPRAASQVLQRGTMENMMMETDSYHSAPVRPASPVAVQAPPPRQADQPPSSQQVSANHHQKHSSSTHHTGGNMGSTHHLKRSPSFSNNQIGSVGAPPPKKHKLYAPRDISHAEAARYGTLNDFSFFDRVRKALRSQEVYENFLRCLLLFTHEIISKSELLGVTAPFFTRTPELQRWLQDFLGPAPASPPAASPPGPGALPNGPPMLSQAFTTGLYLSGGERYTGDSDTLGPLGAHLRQDRPQGDAALEVDLTTCKRLGTSYCALPRGSADSASRRCSGRTALCREVLNDAWVSFPTWAEDSTFVTSRKTQFEEYMYRCEDERFELDVVMETNASAVLALEAVHKRLARMAPDEQARFRLDDCLGGSSPTVHQRALRRIYGDKVAPDIIAGLKKNPLIAVPVVLRRLKAKEEEWREAQKGFNKQWREQNEKYYLKSLDHQGINFKQNDLKSLRHKSLINEIETLFEERRSQAEAGAARAGGPQLCARLGGGAAHATLLADATELLLHHVRRQTAVQKQEKQRIKQLLKHFLPDLFSRPRMPLSDDERDDDDKELDVALDSPGSGAEDGDPTRGSRERDVEPPADPPKPVDVKQEREVSSESDSNTGPAEKGGRRTEKLSSRENKENLKTTRNNSAEEVDIKESVGWSKWSESSGGGGGGGGSVAGARRRDGSPDSCAARVKAEPLDTTPATDITITPSLLPKPDKNSSQSGGGGQAVVFVGSSHWYVFLRLHAVLCQRLGAMRALAARLARDEAAGARLRRPATAAALRLRPPGTLPAAQFYPALLEMVRSVLDGNMEAGAYEDGLREMFGIHAFVAFTLDKVVSYAVRQLQQCVQERTASRCVELHAQERARAGGSSSPSPAAAAAHQRRVERLLREERTYKMCIYGGDDSRVTFELLEAANPAPPSDGSSPPAGAAPGSTPAPTHAPAPPARLADWARYRERYANPSASDTLDLFKEGSGWGRRKAVFLARNVRRFQRRHATQPNGRVGDFVSDDRTDCKFDLNSYSMVFVVNKEQFLYKKDALTRARKSHPRVSLRLDARWQSWLRAWGSRHVTGAMARGCQEWLRRGSRAVTRGAAGARPPYRPYTTYTSLPA